MGLIHPKPRFGLNTDTGLIYDYVDGRDVAPVANYWGADGHWNLLKVRDLIAAQQGIETARIDATLRPKPQKIAPSAITGPVRTTQPPPATPSKPQPPGVTAAQTTNAPLVAHHPMTAPAAEEIGARTSSAPPSSSAIAMTSVDIQKLDLTGLQKAAMGLTLDELNVRGITAERKAALRVTPARAKVLGLTDAQAKALS